MRFRLSSRLTRMIREKTAVDKITAYFDTNYVRQTPKRHISERKLEHFTWSMVRAAIDYKHIDLVAELLYDPRCFDEGRNMRIPHPLLHGLRVDDVKLLEVLLEAKYSGLDRAKVPKFAGESDVADSCYWATDGITAVEYACLLNRPEMIARLVQWEINEHQECDCHSLCDGWGRSRETSLHIVLGMPKDYALLKRQFVLPKIVQAMIDNGSCVHLLNADNLTPLGVFMKKIEDIFQEDFDGSLFVGPSGREDILNTVRVLLEAGSETTRADGTSYLYSINKLLNSFLQNNAYNLSKTQDKDFKLLADIFQLLVIKSTGDSASDFRLFGGDLWMNVWEIASCHHMMSCKREMYDTMMNSLADMFSVLMMRRPGSVSVTELWEYTVSQRWCTEHCYVESFRSIYTYSKESGRSSTFIERLLNTMTVAEVRQLKERLSARLRNLPEGPSEHFAAEKAERASVMDALEFVQKIEVPRRLMHFSRQAVVSAMDYRGLEAASTLPLPPGCKQYILTNNY